MLSVADFSKFPVDWKVGSSILEGRKVSKEEANETSDPFRKVKRIMPSIETLAMPDFGRYKAPSHVLGTGFHVLTPREIA